MLTKSNTSSLRAGPSSTDYTLISPNRCRSHSRSNLSSVKVVLSADYVLFMERCSMDGTNLFSLPGHDVKLHFHCHMVAFCTDVS